jgi:hypothetical protein
MTGTEGHSIPIDWLTKDAIRRGDVDHAKSLIGMISLFYLEHDHPDVYNKLMDMLGVLQGVQRKAVSNNFTGVIDTLNINT